MKLRIGIIGYRNHASRLIELISQNKYCELRAVYHPAKKANHRFATNELQELYKCDAVIISSPNQTHFDYIMNLLNNFSGYIFCEKSPVCSLSHIETLSKLPDSDKNRVYFNYNLRFGLLNGILTNPHYLEKLGNVHHVRIAIGHGLAFKDDYADSWRADGRLNLHAIAETVAIHYVDLLKLNYGNINKYFYSPSIVANTGTSFDTVHISLEFNSVTASIFASYACPFIDEATVIGTDGTLKLLGNHLCLFNPRDSFDMNGHFIEPPMIEKKVINTQNEYMNSLSKSLDVFISHVSAGSDIDTECFDMALSSNRLLLEMQEQY